MLRNYRKSIKTMRDTEFIRGLVPMTKEEIRSVVLGKLDLKKDDCLMDVGAGTGSVAIEAALKLSSGKVVAIELKTEAIDLINANKLKHKVSNLKIVNAKAPEGMVNVSKFNKFFIGGSGGNLTDILTLIFNESPIQTTIVVTAILLDTMNSACQFFKENNCDFELIQVCVNKVDTQKKAAMLLAQNPIFIITAIKR